MSAVVMKTPVPTIEPMVSRVPSHVERPRTRVGDGGTGSRGFARGVAMAGSVAVFPPVRHSSAREVESFLKRSGELDRREHVLWIEVILSRFVHDSQEVMRGGVRV